MPQSVANRVRLAIIRESTPGTTPTSSPRYIPFRYLSASLAGKPKTVISDEIVSDRMVVDAPLVGKDTDGAIEFELSYVRDEYAGLDPAMEGAMGALWTKTPEGDNSVTASGIGVIGSIVAATDYPVTGGGTWAAQMLVSATGFLNAANNKVFVAAASSSATTIKTTGLTTETTPATARLKAIGLQGASGDITATTSSGNALLSTALNFTTMGLTVGQWILIGTDAARAGGADAYSFAGAATVNNGFARISAIAAGRLDLDRVPAGWVTDAGTGKTIRVFFGDYIRNGTTVYSHTIEQFHADITQYQYFKGMVVDTLSFSIEPQAIIKGSVSFKGLDTEIRATQIGTSPSNPSAPTTDVLNSSSNVGRIAENGTAITATPGNYIMSLTLQIANNLRSLPAVGSVGYIGINQGRVMVSGAIKAYFADTTLLAKAIANTASALDFATRDAAGNGYLVDVPKMKLTSAQAVVPGIDQEVMVDLEYQGLKYTPPSGSAYEMHLQRFELAGTAA